MKILTINKFVSFEYEIIDRYVAGIVLLGDEIKSARKGNLNLKEAFGVIRGSEIFLLNFFIGKYSHSFEKTSTDERRSRKLLLTKREIKRLIGEVSLKGLTLIPTKAFLSEKNLLKIEIVVAKHKKLFDKRRSIKEREQNVEAKRELKKLGF